MVKPKDYPKQEDVLAEIDLGKGRASIVRITDENRDYLAEIAMSMYLGEGCKYCDRTFETLGDLKDAVFAGYHERGRLACKSCWIENNP